MNVPDTVRGAELEIGFTAKDLDEAPLQIERFFAQFSTAAAAGMFSGAAAPPSESVFRVNQHEHLGRETRYRCSVRGVDRSAFRILLNGAAEISRRDTPLEAVTIWGGAAGHQDSGLAEILGGKYPGAAKRIPFELKLGDFFWENREPVMRLEFRRGLHDEELERLRTMTEAWDHILTLGGYLDMDDRDGDLLPEPGEFFLAEPTVVEHLIYAYQGPPDTFNGVINMAVRMHESGCRLAAFEIE